MKALANRLPIVVRLPLAAAAMIFIAAVASTQIAIFVMSRQSEQQIDALGQVYLDGISAALLPHVVKGDEAAIRDVLRQALAFHEGVVDQRLLFLGRDPALIVDLSRPGVAAQEELPAQLKTMASGTLPPVGGNVWIWRELKQGADSYGTVAANLDVSLFEDGRQTLRLLLLAFDLAFSGLCAVIGFTMVKRILHPVSIVARHLYQGALGMLQPIEASEFPASDRQAERMFHAFNAMAHASREREALVSHLADQEREAILGRLAATIAHEVRNPLGGMRTALTTLRRFGGQAEAREEAVGFLERGVRTLQEVVTATLESYRARPNWRWLSRQDFEDLRVLIEADSRSRDLAIQIQLDIPDEMPVPALEVRQVLLNLLLNAVQASSKGGTVALRAHVAEDELVMNVSDEGTGLSSSIAHAIETGNTAANSPGLGVAVVIRLVERLQGRVSIDAKLGVGTSITLHIPFRREEKP